MLPAYGLLALGLVYTAQATHDYWGNYRRWSYSQDDGPTTQQEEQFQGYPTNYQPQTTSPVITSTETSVPGHRVLLKGIFQQVLGPNFTSPGLMDLAFLSSGRPSLPLKSQIWDNEPAPQYSTVHQSYEAQSQHSAPQYELPEYIQPPPPPVVDYNYYQ